MSSTKEYQREWAKRNPSKSAQYSKKWREKHPDKYIEAKQNWRERHPGREKELQNIWCDKYPGGVNHCTKWSQEDDITLLSHQGLLYDLVTVLGRSFRALKDRKYVLRHRLTPVGGIPEHLLT